LGVEKSAAGLETERQIDLREEGKMNLQPRVSSESTMSSSAEDHAYCSKLRHDVRGQLAVVIGHLDLLVGVPTLSGFARESVEEALGAAIETIQIMDAARTRLSRSPEPAERSF
jgi:hypothetical protein